MPIDYMSYICVDCALQGALIFVLLEYTKLLRTSLHVGIAVAVVGMISKPIVTQITKLITK